MSHTQLFTTTVRPTVTAIPIRRRDDVEGMLRDMAFVCRLTAQVKASILAEPNPRPRAARQPAVAACQR